MKEIGSFFPIYQCRDSVTSLPDVVPDRQVRYYSLCREALLDIARHYKTDNKRVIAPAYTCRSVIDPFVQEGWECRYYDVSTDLRIKPESIVPLSESFKPGVCIAHPYFGADLTEDELQALEQVGKQTGCLMVEDTTQGIFSTVRHSVFDVIVGSCRKWFPIPDGGFLCLMRPVPGLEAQEYDYPENESFVSLMSDAMYLRGIYLQSGNEEIKSISRRMSALSLSEIEGRIQPHRMSDYSMKLMFSSDAKEIQKSRMDNYRFLHEGLKDSDNLKLVRKSVTEVKSAPLYFPIYVKDRDSFQKSLARENIFAMALWQSSKSPEMVSSPDVDYIFNHILAITCDQRYDETDMKRVVDVIRNIDV